MGTFGIAGRRKLDYRAFYFCSLFFLHKNGLNYRCYDALWVEKVDKNVVGQEGCLIFEHVNRTINIRRN